MRPLDGYRVLEYCDAHCPPFVHMAVSMATKIAADLGADVIKLEPRQGDALRRSPPLFMDGEGRERSFLFEFLNTSKRSIVLDDAEPSWPAALGRLARASQAIVQGADASSSLPPGSDGDVGHLTRVLVTPFGDDPAWRDVPSSELTVLALGGLLQMIGEPASEPLRFGGHQPAYAAGLAAFSGLVAGLAAPDRRGLEDVRVAALDVVTWLNWKAVLSPKPVRRQGSASEWQVVPCQDGFVAVVYQQEDWPNMLRLTGVEALADARFRTRAGREEHRDELMAHIRRWFAPRTKEEVTRLARAYRIPLGPVLTPRELRHDPQYAARDFIRSLGRMGERALDLPQLPVLWNGARPRSTAAPPLPTAGGGDP